MLGDFFISPMNWKIWIPAGVCLDENRDGDDKRKNFLSFVQTDADGEGVIDLVQCFGLKRTDFFDEALPVYRANLIDKDD